MIWIDTITGAMILIAVLGFLALPVLGSFAIQAAGEGKALLPKFFRVSVLLVMACHLYFHYRIIFPGLPEGLAACVEFPSICAIAKVIGVPDPNEPYDSWYSPRVHTFEFRRSSGRIVRYEKENLSDFYIEPKLHDEILISYRWDRKRSEVVWIELNLPRRYDWQSKLFFSLSFVLGFICFVMDQKIRRRSASYKRTVEQKKESSVFKSSQGHGVAENAAFRRKKSGIY